MARIDKATLTRLEIVSVATTQFLEKGYSNTGIASIVNELGMSKGTLAFHFPTKEHMLRELVELLCKFQWKQIEKEADEGISSVLAICLELAAMAGACEEDEYIKDFFLASYTSQMCLDFIRRNDAERAKEVFSAYRPDWNEEKFAEAEILVSGIEFGTLMTAGAPVSFEIRVAGALNNILGIYGVPEEIREAKIKKVFAMNYRHIGKQAIADFKQYVAKTNDKALRNLLHIE